MTDANDVPICTCFDDWHAYNAENHAPTCPVIAAFDTLTRERDEARRDAERLAKQGRHIIAEFKKLRGDTMDVECVLALAGLDRMLDARTADAAQGE